jgi:hypothetical protein
MNEENAHGRMPDAVLSRGTVLPRYKVLFKLEKDEDGYPPDDWETLWGQKVGTDLYRLDNIPFFARDVSCGDEIAAENCDGTLYYLKTVNQASNSVLRVVLYDEDKTAMLRSRLAELGCETELIGNLVAIDIPGQVNLDVVLEFLESGEKLGNWEYETASLRQ